MNTAAHLLFALCALFTASFAHAAGKSDSEPANDEQPGLPRVLILGDSVCLGYTPPLAEGLKGKVNLFKTHKNGGSTLRALERMDGWLANGKWDVIHFNWGIQDMMLGEDGKLQVEPDAYEKNLRTLVAKLKATGATLVWATITPIPKGFGDVETYNAVAKRVMEENGIAVDDLYTSVLPHVAEYQLPLNVHYNPEGCAFIAAQVSASIEAALKTRK